MARIPTFTYQGSVSVGGAAQTSVADPVGASLQQAGRDIGSFGAAYANYETRVLDKMVQQDEQQHQVNLQHDLLTYKNQLQSELVNQIDNGPESGVGIVKSIDDRANALAEADLKNKYANRTDKDAITLAYRKTADGVLNHAASVELQARKKFMDDTSQRTIADAAATVAANPELHDQVMTELTAVADRFQFTGRVRDKFLSDAQRDVAVAAVSSKAGADPRGFITQTAPYFEGGQASSDHPEAQKIIAGSVRAGADVNTMLGIAHIESRLNPAVRPVGRDGRVLSTAEGVFQVLGKSPEDTYRKTGLRITDKMDTEEVAAQLGQYINAKTDWMKANGITPTPGRQYAFWNLGEGMATALVRADPNKPVTQVAYEVYGNRMMADGRLWRDVVLSNNPSLYKPGMTAGQALDGLDAKMAEGVKQTSKLIEGGGLISDERASDMARQVTGVTTISGIRAADMADIYKKAADIVRKEDAKKEALVQGEARVNGTVSGLFTDPHNPQHQKEIDAYGEATGVAEKMRAGDPKAFSEAVRYANSTNYVPRAFVNEMRSAVQSGAATPVAMASYATLSVLHSQNPIAFDAAKIDGETTDKVRKYRALTETTLLTPKEAVERIAAMDTPEFKKAAEANKENLKTLKQSLSYSDVASAMKSGVFSASAPTVGAEAALTETYKEAFAFHFTKSGDETTAKALAAQDMQRFYGETRAGGRKSFTALPVEKMYPADPNGKHDYITEQAQNLVAAHLVATKAPGYTEAVSPAFPSAQGEPIPQGKHPTPEVFLVPRAETMQDYRAGDPRPRYELMYKDAKGIFQMHPDRWFRADTTQAANVAREAFVKKNNESRAAIQNWPDVSTRDNTLR